MSESYVQVIIWGGSAGLTAAGFAVQLGARPALIEKHRTGGDCTWTGCVPSNTLLKTAKVAQQMRTANLHGLSPGDPTVDLKCVMASRFTEEGFDLRFNSMVESAWQDGDGIHVGASDGELVGDALLVAVGRGPNVASLELDRAGATYSEDGLEGSEGTFTICTFWLANSLISLGEVGQARDLFDRLRGCANDLGLFSEQLDVETGELLGNFPQAFSHMAPINTAVQLGKAVSASAPSTSTDSRKT